MKNEHETQKLLEVTSLKKYFPIRKGLLRRLEGYVKAVDNVSLYINEGETLGLVGESGCGKTTVGRCITRAIEPTEGTIRLRFSDDEMIDFTALDKSELHSKRKYLNMVFQDPYASLNPRMTILDIIGEPLLANNIARGEALIERVKEVVNAVGLEVKHLKRYPHAFSGGQRQRIGIARALAVNPKLIIADEPVSALDVSIQAQILNLLKELQRTFQLTYLFIAHDLSVVEHISDRVGVMYVGRMIEMAETEELFNHPQHPYTEALLSAVPSTDIDIKMERILLPGEIANPVNPPSGCYFHPRCLYAQDVCRQETPQWEEVEPEHFVACHLAKELQLKGVVAVESDA